MLERRRTSSSSARSATAKSRLPRRRQGAAVPDRLAGAVRAGDDRGHGLRHAGDRLRARLRPRSDRGRRHRLSGRTRSTRRSSAWTRCESLDRAAIRRTFERRFSAERMASDYVAIYQRMRALAKAKSRIQAVNGHYNASSLTLTGERRRSGGAGLCDRGGNVAGRDHPAQRSRTRTRSRCSTRMATRRRNLAAISACSTATPAICQNCSSPSAACGRCC